MVKMMHYEKIVNLYLTVFVCGAGNILPGAVEGVDGQQSATTEGSPLRSPGCRKTS